MAFELTITAPFRFSFNASSGHLSMLFGRHDRGFVLESLKNPSGKLVETWRNEYCNSLNVAALGMLLVVG